MLQAMLHEPVKIIIICKKNPETKGLTKALNISSYDRSELSKLHDQNFFPAFCKQDDLTNWRFFLFGPKKSLIAKLSFLNDTRKNAMDHRVGEDSNQRPLRRKRGPIPAASFYSFSNFYSYLNLKILLSWVGGKACRNIKLRLVI